MMNRSQLKLIAHIIPVTVYLLHHTCHTLSHTASQGQVPEERWWLKSGLEAQKQIFHATCKFVKKIMQQAKSKFFNTQIRACTSSKQLFHITNTLLGKSKTSSLLSSIPSALLLQRFCDFFVYKISTIHDSLNFQTLPLPPVTHKVFDGSSLTAFHPLSELTVCEGLNKTTVKTCELDPLPSSLLAELIDYLLPSITSVTNDSLLTGSFPSAFKSTVVRPLLKKSSLDTENLNEFFMRHSMAC